jgi:hypothetical protein
MQEQFDTMVSLYVVKTTDGKYFAGFDVDNGCANYVTDPRAGKKFTNKYDIKLRPGETLVELTVDLSKSDVQISEPFRPQRRVKQSAAK